MNTKTATFLTGLIIFGSFSLFAQSPAPLPANTPPSPPVPNAVPPVPYGNHIPGSTAPYTTPPVIQQTSPPPATNPPPFPAGPTYTTTPAPRAPFPPDAVNKPHSIN